MIGYKLEFKHKPLWFSVVSNQLHKFKQSNNFRLLCVCRIEGSEDENDYGLYLTLKHIDLCSIGKLSNSFVKQAILTEEILIPESIHEFMDLIDVDKTKLEFGLYTDYYYSVYEKQK